jgi:hypothetical protein
LAFFAQAVEVKRNGLAHVLFDFLACATVRDAAGQIR